MQRWEVDGLMERKRRRLFNIVFIVGCLLLLAVGWRFVSYITGYNGIPLIPVILIGTLLNLRMVRAMKGKYIFEIVQDSVSVIHFDHRGERYATWQISFSEIKDYRCKTKMVRETIQIRLTNSQDSIDLIRVNSGLGRFQNTGVLCRIIEALEQNLNAYYASHPEIAKAKRIRSAF